MIHVPCTGFLHRIKFDLGSIQSFMRKALKNHHLLICISLKGPMNDLMFPLKPTIELLGKRNCSIVNTYHVSACVFP